MDFIYSKIPEENLRQRVKLLLAAKNDVEIQQIIKRKCYEDPIFFFNMFLFTFKPKAVGDEGEPENPNVPFITFPFQDEYIMEIIGCIRNSEDNSTEKSREMGFSWMVLGAAGIWGFLFEGWSGLIGSYKEDYVDTFGDMDSAFERLRYMLERLPEWMKPSDIVSKYMSISSKQLGAELSGDSGSAFGTGGRRKWIFLDEFALWAFDKTAFRKTKDVTNCRIFGGTPEGKGNVYGKLMTNHPDYVHIRMRKFRLHWRMHPLKTEAWYERQQQERTKADLASEIDINYDDSVAGAVYGDFERLVRFQTTEYNPKFKLYSSWDFGRDSNALIIWQKDFQYDKLYVIRSFRKVDWDIDKFAAYVTGEPTQGYEYDREELEEIASMQNLRGLYAGHFGDPYNGDAKTTNAKTTIKDILGEMGIYLTLKLGSTVETRITATSLSLRRITIDYNKNIDLVESMRQSKYPKVKEGSQSTAEKTKPVHDENSHFRTAFEYFIDNEPQQLAFQQQDAIFHNKMTGQMIQGGRPKRVSSQNQREWSL